MSDHSATDCIAELLATPVFEEAAAPSPTLRESLLGLLRQIEGEIARLSPLVEHACSPDRARLAATVQRRQALVLRLRHVLAVSKAIAM